MALMTIRLIRDPKSGKQNIIVKLDSDADSLPHEHEELHRKLVQKLVGQGMPIEDIGHIHIERETGPVIQEKKDEEPGTRTKESAGQT